MSIMRGNMPEIMLSREYDGLWWPDGEEAEHLRDYMLRRVTDVDLLLPHVQTKCIAVQAGGFVGMWAIRLAKFFERVYTFEPVPELYNCLVMNTRHLPGVRPSQVALSDSVGTMQLQQRYGGHTSTRAGDDAVPLRVDCVNIDSLKLLRLDALLLDIEGGELAALAGARETISRHRPALILEVHAAAAEPVARWAGQNGYELVERVHADCIYVSRSKPHARLHAA